MRFFRSSRRRFVAPAVVVVLAAGLLSGVAAAAQAPDATAPAALRDALHAAWQQHPSYRATQAQLTAARARLDAAWQPLYNPEFELVVDDEGPDRTATTGLNLTLDVNGKRRVRRDAAAARVDQAIAEAKLRRRDFARQWFASWAELQTAQKRVETGERRLVLVNRFAGLADKQFAAGDISGLERDLALLARDEAQAEQSQLVGERAVAEARFRSVGGAPESGASLTLLTNALPSSVASPSSIEDLPDLQVVQTAAVAAEHDVTIARRNRLPDPTVGVRGGRVDYGGLRDNVFGLSISIPLLVRNSYRAEVVAAQADADIAIAEAERVRIELDADQRRAIESYAASQAAWSQWQASRGTDIQRRTDLLERLWREGEMSTSDYLQQLKQTLDTALAGAELEARVWRTYTDYLAATGQLERWAGLEGAP